MWSRAAEPGPVQIIHWFAGASLSTVAAVISVVQSGPAIRQHAQDHLSELRECLDVWSLGWSTEQQPREWNSRHATVSALERETAQQHYGCGRLTEREAHSQEKQSPEGGHHVNAVVSRTATVFHPRLYKGHRGTLSPAPSAVHAICIRTPHILYSSTHSEISITNQHV